MPIAGVEFEQQSDCYICHVTDLSDELKALIRKRLSSICHGRFRSETEGEFYNYKRTLIQFNTLIEDKGDLIQKGMIGELLFHILIVEMIDTFRVISPFFNLEEKSIKKGYDVILADSINEEIWMVEAKSGERDTENTGSNSKNLSLLKTARSDLRTRLNSANTQRWQSALNGLAFTEGDGDRAKLLKKILQGEFIKAENENANAANHNAILSSNVFAELTDKIAIDNVVELKTEIDSQNTFKKTLLFSIQKTTFQKMIEFLKEEAQNV